MNLLRNEYFQHDVFYFYLPHWCRAELCEKYINIFSEIMFVLCLCVKGIPWECTYFPLWSFVIVEFIVNIVVGSFGSLFSKAINNSHLFRNIFFRFCISGGCSESIMGSWWFFAFPHLSKSWVYFSIGEFDKILIGICFLLFFFRWFVISHFDDINNVTLK